MARYQLTIDLDALARNWHQLKGLCSAARCSAVVKADAYGLGVKEVATRLCREGCEDFFVATVTEALELRAALPSHPKIYVLSGIFPGEERLCIEHDLVPTLVSVEMFERWVEASRGERYASAIKVDSGMGRLGLSIDEANELGSRVNCFRDAGVELVISHLACADEPDHPLNFSQLLAFRGLRERLSVSFPELRFSLANSAGCALGNDYHFDLVRPGLSLYGVNASKLDRLDLRPAIRLSLAIIQLRMLQSGQSAGYGAEFVADGDRCLAVVAGGYADGIFRALGGCSYLYLGESRVPIVGRVSMDSILVDVTGLGLEDLGMEQWPSLELIGEHQGVENLSADSGISSYEILTSLGQRFERVYVSGGAK